MKQEMWTFFFPISATSVGKMLIGRLSKCSNIGEERKVFRFGRGFINPGQ